MSIIAHGKRKIKRGIRTFNLPSEDDFPTGIPSDNYSAQTVISAGQYYTAPTDGFYFAIATSGSNAKSYLGFITDGTPQYMGNSVIQYTGGQGMWTSCACHKGQKITFGYANVSSISVYFIKSKTAPHLIKY